MKEKENITMSIYAVSYTHLIVNTPNNPTGVIYKPETMEAIASILEKKQKEFGHDIYLCLLYTSYSARKMRDTQDVWTIRQDRITESSR